MNQPTQDFPRDPQAAVARYRQEPKMAQVTRYEQGMPYTFHILLYHAPLSAFTDPMDFYANTGRNPQHEPAWQWQELSAADWAGIQDDRGDTFGPRSTLGSLREQLTALGLSDPAQFVRGWRLFESWIRGNTWDRDDEYTLIYLAQTTTHYLFFVFTGYVVH
ncbi:MAG: hypothetical protein L0322_16445 [Chloroflexi bacterium]|nr:hypothetical protein [Chloroflexota bacterium]